MSWRPPIYLENMNVKKCPITELIRLLIRSVLPNLKLQQQRSLKLEKLIEKVNVKTHNQIDFKANYINAAIYIELHLL